MKLLFSFGFSIRNKKYYALVRAAEKTGCTEYHVRIMNRRLDRWLYGHHVFTAANGRVTCIASDCPDKVRELRIAVHAALTDQLQNPAALAPSTQAIPLHLQPGSVLLNRTYGSSIDRTDHRSGHRGHSDL